MKTHQQLAKHITDTVFTVHSNKNQLFFLNFTRALQLNIYQNINKAKLFKTIKLYQPTTQHHTVVPNKNSRNHKKKKKKKKNFFFL